MSGRTIYICRECHRVGARALTCHPRASAKCDAGAPGDERSMPLFDAQGRLVTRAPKWWVEACFKAGRVTRGPGRHQKIDEHRTAQRTSR